MERLLINPSIPFLLECDDEFAKRQQAFSKDSNLF